MSKIDCVGDKEGVTNGNEVNKSHDEGTKIEEDKRELEQLKEEEANQKESARQKAGELTDFLLKDEKMPINDFIENSKKKGMDELTIVSELIKKGYQEDEIMSSSIGKWYKNEKANAISETFLSNIFRFEDEKEIEEKFFSIAKEVITKDKHWYDVLRSIPLKRAITMEDIKYGEKKVHERYPDNHYSVDLSGEILPDFDWSKSRDVFKYLAFDDKTFSKTKKEHLPEGFDPKTVFENGKTIGLGIEDVHKMGYTGKGVSVAICDWQLKPHKDIPTAEYTVNKNASKFDDYFHASAVSSILTGKQTGISPDADLYFFAEVQNNAEKDGGQDLALSLSKILERNKELSDNKKIRVVSISGPLYGGKETEIMVKKLEDSGVWVLHSGEFRKDFGYLEKRDPMGNPNDLQNYQHYLGRRNALFINSGDRTVASPQNDSSYRHDTEASASWAIPVVAGYYALACQADPTMTPERFKKLAKDSARMLKTDIKHGGSIFSKLGLKAKIRVIDIKALIQKIEEQKKK